MKKYTRMYPLAQLRAMSVAEAKELDPGKLLPLRYFKATAGCCWCKRRYHVADFRVVYQQVRDMHPSLLTIAQKNLILVRFNRITSTIQRRYTIINHAYTASKLFVISTGILNPALLTLGYSDGDSPTDTMMFTIIFWMVWSLQLLSSLTTAFSSFLKLDRRYLLLKAFKTRAEQEGWSYLELVGRYGQVDVSCEREVAAGRTFHDTKLKLLLFRLEVLFRKLKQLTLDLDAAGEDDSGPSGVGQGKGGSSGAETPDNSAGNGAGDTFLGAPGDGATGAGTPRSHRLGSDVSRALLRGAAGMPPRFGSAPAAGGRTSRAASRVLPTINVGDGSAESFVTNITVAPDAGEEDALGSDTGQLAQTAGDRVTGALVDDEATA